MIVNGLSPWMAATPDNSEILQPLCRFRIEETGDGRIRLQAQGGFQVTGRRPVEHTFHRPYRERRQFGQLGGDGSRLVIAHDAARYGYVTVPTY